MEKFYKKGAEAELTQTTFDNITAINKKRIAKNYRNPKLDFDIRKKEQKQKPN